MIVGFQMDFQMVASRESAGAMLAFVSFVACVQFNMPIAASFVLKFFITKIAYKLAGRMWTRVRLWFQMMVRMVVIVMVMIHVRVIGGGCSRGSTELLLVGQRRSWTN